MKRPLSRWPFLAICAIAALLLASCLPTKPALTAPADPLAGKTVIARDLHQPRQLMYDRAGTLYIAEAGVGGDSWIAPTVTSKVAAGLSSRITAVTKDGVQSVILAGLPSIASQPGGENFFGAQAVYATSDTLWVTTGYGPAMKTRALPFTSSLIAFDRTTWRVKNLVDLWSAAVANHRPSDEEAPANPADLVLTSDGVIYIADASCNCVWRWTAKDGLKLFLAWTSADNPVPTGIALGPDGDLYVSFLSGFPFKPGNARIECWSRGVLKQKYAGLTMLTDVLVTPENRIFAVQFAEFGDKGPKPNSGKVIEVTATGARDVMTGLNAPYALALSPDNKLVVSVGTTSDKNGQGAVIVVEGYP